MSANDFKNELEKTLYGQSDLIEESLVCLIAGGHQLITGAPGLAKTTLVKKIAKLSGLSFGRVQFTPDLMPMDITGSEILDNSSSNSSFRFEKGPVFCNFLLADEINRASPKTQAALLEAMEEKKITMAGKTYDLPLPFFVFATENPVESVGTYELPEAQKDRFLLNSFVPYPDKESEKKIYTSLIHAENKIDSALPSGDLDLWKKEASEVRVPEPFIEALTDFIRFTRPESNSESLYSFGAGPRAGISILSCARAKAYMEGRDEILWTDISRFFNAALRHRLVLDYKALKGGLSMDESIEQTAKKFRERVENNYSLVWN